MNSIVHPNFDVDVNSTVIDFVARDYVDEDSICVDGGCIGVNWDYVAVEDQDSVDNLDWD